MINPHPSVGVFTGALGEYVIALGDEVLEAANIGTLRAELYPFLAILNLLNGLFRLSQGTLKGVYLGWALSGGVDII